MAQAGAGPSKTFSWILGKGPDGEPKMCCYTSPECKQIAPKLWETVKLTSFHDAELARVSKEINAIIQRVEKKNRNSKRFLSQIIFESRPFLVWAEYGMIGPHDSRDEVIKALGLKKR